MMKKLALLLLVLLPGLLAGGSATAQSIWPLNSSWTYIPAQNDWGIIRDFTGDMSPPNADISSRGSFRNITIGDMASVYIYGDGQYLYFRWLLSGNPLSFNNSAGYWMIDSRSSYPVLLDVNNDNVQDWAVAVSKSNAITLFQGTSSTPIRTVSLGPITKSGSVYTDSTSFIRVTDLGFGNTDQGPTNPDNLHYLDLRVPLSWFSNIGPTTFFRPYLGTSNNDNNINKDYMIAGATAANFNAVAPIYASDPTVQGAMYDARDTAPSSSGGTWRSGETVQITGYGWPSGAAIPVEIRSPDGTLVWSGTVTANASGTVAPTNSWVVPGNTSGLYSIYVAYPSGSAYRLYDTFTVVGPRLTLSKGTNRVTAAPGDTVTYTLTYGNSGSDAASNVVITDAIPANATFIPGSASGANTTVTYSHDGGQTFDSSSALPVTHIRWTRTTLASGTTGQTLSFQVTVNAPAPDQSILANTATAQATGISSFSSNTVTTTVQRPVLTASKSADKTQASRGELINYTITYGNTGSGSLSNLTITDQIPTGTMFVSAGTGNSVGTTILYSSDGQNFSSTPPATVSFVRWLRSSLPANTTNQTVTLQVRVSDSAVIGSTAQNSATLSASNISNITTNTVSTTVIAPQLTLSKAADKATAISGDLINYTLTYGNTGSAAATSVQITDTLPANTTFVSATTGNGSGVTLQYSADGQTFSASPTQPVRYVRWVRDTLPAGTTNQTVTLQVRVNSGLADQSALNNSATIQAQGVALQASNTVTTTIYRPIIQITKTVDKAFAQPNEVLTYTLTYINSGHAPAYGLVITDTIPSNSVYVAGSATGTGTVVTFQHTEGGRYDANDALPVYAIRWELTSPIPPNSSGTVRFQVRIGQ